MKTLEEAVREMWKSIDPDITEEQLDKVVPIVVKLQLASIDAESEDWGAIRETSDKIREILHRDGS